jgi:hypothetical protein
MLQAIGAIRLSILVIVLLALGLLLGSCGGSTTKTPAAPSNVTVTPHPGFIRVGWQDNSTDETAFVIYRDAVGGAANLTTQALTQLAEVPANTTSYDDQNVTVGTSYRYAVAAKGAEGNSSQTGQSGEAVSPENSPPTITSSTTPSAAENQTSVIDVQSTDPEGDTEGAGLTYSLTGGADQALFSIDTNTGVLTFKAAPDFETPGDINTDNVYEVKVTVTDSGNLTDVQNLQVTVTNVNEEIDDREFNHSANIVEYLDGGELKYYLTWSSSYGMGWEHDIYRKLLELTAEGDLVQSEAYTLIDTNEAQEPVSTAAKGAVLLSAWEDGSGDTIDVHGRLHSPDGSSIAGKDDFIIAGGDDSQHSASTALIGNFFAVAYADEAPPAQHAMIKVQVLSGSDASSAGSLTLTNATEDHWWPVVESGPAGEALIIWGDGYELYANLLEDNGTGVAIASTNKAIAINIKQYHYHSQWLKNISQYLVVVGTPSGSKLLLLDPISAAVSTSLDVEYQVSRETKMAAIWDSVSSSYKIAFTTGVNDIALFRASSNAPAIEKFQLISGESTTELSSVRWPTTGIAMRFVKSTTGIESFSGENILIVAFNRVDSNDLHMLSLRLGEGF